MKRIRKGFYQTPDSDEFLKPKKVLLVLFIISFQTHKNITHSYKGWPQIFLPKKITSLKCNQYIYIYIYIYISYSKLK